MIYRSAHGDLNVNQDRSRILLYLWQTYCSMWHCHTYNVEQGIMGNVVLAWAVPNYRELQPFLAESVAATVAG